MPTLADKARKEPAPPTVTLVPIGQIAVNPFGFDRPNTEALAKYIQSLADSIVKMKTEGGLPYGLIHYPKARYMQNQRWQIVDGYCRLLAFKMLDGNEQHGFNLFPVIMGEFTDDQMAEVAWRENQDRQDIDPVAMARWYKKQIDAFGYTQEQLGQKRGISQSAIAHSLRILALPAEVLAFIQDGTLTPRHGRELLAMATMPNELVKLAVSAVKNNAPVGDLARQVRQTLQERSKSIDKNAGSRGPAFKIDECTGCKHAVELAHPWEAGKTEMRCLDPTCWEKKQDAAQKVLEAKRQKEVDKMLASVKGSVATLPIDKALKIAEKQTQTNLEKSQNKAVKQSLKDRGLTEVPEAEKGEEGTGDTPAAAPVEAQPPEEKVKTIDLEKLGSNDYTTIYERSMKELDNPAECRTCEHKSLGRYGNSVNLVCLDPKCYRRKKTVKTRMENKAKKEEDKNRFTGMDLVLQTLMTEKKSPLTFRPILLVLAEQILTHYSPGRPNKWREDYGLEDSYAHGSASTLEKWLEPLDDAKLVNMIARESYLRSGEASQKTTLAAMKLLVKLPEQTPVPAEEVKKETKKKKATKK